MNHASASSTVGHFFPLPLFLHLFPFFPFLHFLLFFLPAASSMLLQYIMASLSLSPKSVPAVHQPITSSGAMHRPSLFSSISMDSSDSSDEEEDLRAKLPVVRATNKEK